MKSKGKGMQEKTILASCIDFPSFPVIFQFMSYSSPFISYPYPFSLHFLAFLCLCPINVLFILYLFRAMSSQFPMHFLFVSFSYPIHFQFISQFFSFHFLFLSNSNSLISFQFRLFQFIWFQILWRGAKPTK